MRRFLAITAAACFTGSLMAQSVVTAKAGLVHYLEGDVTLDSAMLSTKPGKFAEMKKGSVLKTLEGRAEVLLAPGSSVRLSENSALKMTSTSLEDTRFTVTAGSAMVEVGDMDKFMSIVVAMGDTEVSLRKKGLYRFEAEPASLRVFEGEASLSDDGKSTMIGRGRMVSLNGGEVLLAKFDPKDGDELYRWSKRRSYYMSMANLSAANSLRSQGTTSFSSFGGFTAGGWFYNPYFGMFTYVPSRGGYMSPWGFGYYTPRMAYDFVNQVNSPQNSFQGGGFQQAYSGYQGTGRMNTSYDSNLGYSVANSRSSGGYSGVSSPAASGGGDGGMRGGGGGGGVSGGAPAAATGGG
ncbi:MAG: FecR family protein, partial [Bryobacteraceae bacterium]|nr:FecR family protein [Bryobacteraceae bacterium]